MQSSCQFKTSDGKRKDKGRKKPRLIQQSKKRLKSLKRKLGV
jgi:hypothetical protein